MIYNSNNAHENDGEVIIPGSRFLPFKGVFFQGFITQTYQAQRPDLAQMSFEQDAGTGH